MHSTNHPEGTLKNIVLVGFMGCGKSSVGRAISSQLNYPQIDIDCSISDAAALTIPQIFESKGEAHFRLMETECLQQIIAEKIHHHIISTGGGIPVASANRALLPQLGYVVWLRARPQTIFERTQNTKHRPLLNQEDRLQTITQLLEQRTPLYEEVAQLKVNTDELPVDEISHGIIESARYFFKNS